MEIRFLVRRIAFVSLLAAIAAAMGALFSLTAADAAQGIVRVDSATTGIGQTATISLSGEEIPEPGLGAWTIDVEYDPDVVSAVGCQADHGAICNSTFSAHSIRVAGISLGGLVGDVALAQITFLCIAPGTSVLSVDVDVLSDTSLGNPQEIDATEQGGALTCSEHPPTPTSPPTVTPIPPAATLTPEPPVEPPGSDPDKLRGDADCDLDVDSIDAAFVLQFEAGLVSSVACENNADANHDGRVGPIDAAIILQASAGLL